MSDIVTQILIIGVLFLFLGIGLLYKQTPSTLKEYALGKGRIATPILIATMVATAIGGGNTIGRSAAFYQHGVGLFLATCFMPIGYCLMSLLIIPRLSKYYGCLSVAEIAGRMYGKYAKKVIAVSAVILCLGALGAQLKALHWVIGHVFVENTMIVTVIALVAVIFYSGVGGVSSVIRTDIAQFFIFIVIIPLVAIYMIYISGGIGQIIADIPEPKRMILPDGKIAFFISAALLQLLPDVNPTSLHRFLIGKDYKKNQAATYALAVVGLIITIFVGCIAFIALSKFSNINPKDTIFVAVSNIIPFEGGIMLFAIALIAVIVSTADSLINTSAIILVNDIFVKEITEEQKIKLLRLVTVLSGIVATAITFLFSSVLSIVWFFSEYYMIVVMIPLIAGLFLTELKKQAFWVSVVVGSTLFSILHLVQRDLDHGIFLMGLVASFCAYFITFFIVRNNKSSGWDFSLSRICDSIMKKIPIKNFYLACVIIAYYFLSLIFIYNFGIKYTTTWLICGGVGTLGVLLFFADKIFIKYKNIIAVASMCYCFVFVPIYFFLSQPAGAFLIVSFAGSMMFMMALFTWEVFLSFLLLGSVTACITYWAFGQSNQHSLVSFIYLSFFISFAAVISYICFRMRDDKQDQKNIMQKVLSDVVMFSDAENYYKNILLKEKATTEISFEDLQSNMLKYFKKLEIEKHSKLIICDLKQENFNTVLPANIFYKIAYSLISNVMYCAENETISIKFHCDRENILKKIEIIHGDYDISGKLSCLKDCQFSYLENILKWHIMEQFFEKLAIAVQGKNKKLTINFPSKIPLNTDNVFYCDETLNREVVKH